MANNLNGSGITPPQVFGPAFPGPTLSLIPVIDLNHNPTVADRNYPIMTFARNSNVNSASYLSIWYLQQFQGFTNGQPNAIWVQLGSSSGPLLEFAVPAGSSPVVPSASGLVTYTSTDSTIVITGSTNTINFDIAGGSVALEGLIPDAHTSPGTSPVVPSSGNITLEGGATFATGTQANPILTNSLAAHKMDFQIQLAGSNDGVSTPNNFGVCQFDSNPFNVVDGFVQANPAVANANSIFSNIGMASFNNANFSVDSNGFVSLLTTPTPIEGVSNIGIGLSGTTFTVFGSDGTALSSSNPGNVTLQTFNHPGQLRTYQIEANQSFTKAGLGNSLFGLTSAVDESFDIPFFLYAVCNANNGGNTIAFMISRVPHATIAPLAANIGQSGNTNASTQGSFFSLKTITAADYASAPCVCIGSFRMRYASSLWTVQTLSLSDGIGEFQDNTAFTFPPGQYGAASGKWFTDNGGTAPGQEGSSPGYVYFVDRTGLCTWYMAIPAATAGSGSVNLTQVLPFLSASGGQCGSGYISTASFALVSMVSITVPGSSQTTNVFAYTQNGGGGVFTNANIVDNVQFGTNGFFQISLL